MTLCYKKKLHYFLRHTTAGLGFSTLVLKNNCSKFAYSNRKCLIACLFILYFCYNLGVQTDWVLSCDKSMMMVSDYRFVLNRVSYIEYVLRSTCYLYTWLICLTIFHIYAKHIAYIWELFSINWCSFDQSCCKKNYRPTYTFKLSKNSKNSLSWKCLLLLFWLFAIHLALSLSWESNSSR